MKINYTGLLQKQLDLQLQPRGRQRFQNYIDEMMKDDGSDVEFAPLVLVNPMARDHVTDLLKQWVALDADGIAEKVCIGATNQIQSLPGEFRAGVVLVDDAKGGWTNRYSFEYEWRRISSRAELNDKQADRYWITGILWSSEPVDTARLENCIASALFRTAYVEQFGKANTVREFLSQESTVAILCPHQHPVLDSAELNSAFEIVECFFDETSQRAFIECLFGDPASESLGYTKLGLPEWAGLELAKSNGRENRFGFLQSPQNDFLQKLL